MTDVYRRNIAGHWKKRRTQPLRQHLGVAFVFAEGLAGGGQVVYDGGAEALFQKPVLGLAGQDEQEFEPLRLGRLLCRGQQRLAQAWAAWSPRWAGCMAMQANSDIADTGSHSVSRCARRDHSAHFGIYG